MSEISSTSPNYFHLSDIPISPAVLLRGDNYTEWSTNIRNLLQAKQKFGFIDGSIPKPLTKPDLTRWLKTNYMISDWILTTIDPKIRSAVDSIVGAKELWETLKCRLSLGIKARVYQLKAEIGACKQDGQSVDDYHSRFCQLWEELHCYKSIRNCSCDAAKDIEKEKEDERVYQFLMGLDDFMKTKIDFIIMGKAPLPDLYQAYCLMITEEKHLQSKGLKHVLSCSHCGRKGHEVKECFALHGYPEERQRNKSSNTRRRRGKGASSSGNSTNAQGRVNASQTALTNQSLKSHDLINLYEFQALLNLRAMQDPISNIYSAGPSSASDSNWFPMAQKSEAKGGNGGKEWDDGANYEGVSQMYIREGCQGIESIKFDYVKNGQPKAGPIHGGSGYSEFTEWFDLNHICDEHIVSVKCYFDEGAIQGFVVKTNITTSALMGYNLGTTFKLEVKGKKIIGFHGSSDQNLHSLGAYFAPLSHANLNF